jgi:PBSX family phage portal protein
MASEDVIEKNKLVGRAIVVKARNMKRETTQALPEDPFTLAYGQYGVIEPPFDMLTLTVMPESSSELGPAIEAMQINIEGLGHRVILRDGISKDEENVDLTIKKELAKVSNFFANAVLEPTETFTTLRKNLRSDLEVTGNAYVEVLESLATGEPAGLKHLPSFTMRLRKMDEEFTDHDVARSIKSFDGKWSIEKFPYSSRFRRYVQIRDGNMTEMVYFKEWGDPRHIDSKTAEVIPIEEVNKPDFDRSRLANSVIHFKLYCPRSPYGLPRYIGNLFQIYGNRAAETINYVTFRNNNIPSMMMLATNVQLTEGSIDRLQKFVEERIQGDENYSTFIIVEAEPISESLRDPGTMKLELKNLVENQHNDALFVNYMERNDDKIRRAFRLPPIFLGKSDDYTRATAESSIRIGEEQIFRPERNDSDAVWNQTIVPALGAASVVFKSNTPDVTDNYELTQLLAVAERSGGLSPFISRIIIEDVLGRDLPDISDEIDSNLPFSLTILRESMKQAADQGEINKTFTDNELLDQFKLLGALIDGRFGVPKHVQQNVKQVIRMLEMEGNNVS